MNNRWTRWWIVNCLWSQKRGKYTVPKRNRGPKEGSVERQCCLHCDGEMQKGCWKQLGRISEIGPTMDWLCIERNAFPTQEETLEKWEEKQTYPKMLHNRVQVVQPRPTLCSWKSQQSQSGSWRPGGFLESFWSSTHVGRLGMLGLMLLKDGGSSSHNKHRYTHHQRAKTGRQRALLSPESCLYLGQPWRGTLVEQRFVS